jgi:hypothetical protein
MQRVGVNVWCLMHGRNATCATARVVGVSPMDNEEPTGSDKGYGPPKPKTLYILAQQGVTISK